MAQCMTLKLCGVLSSNTRGRVDPPIVGHHHILDIKSEKFLLAKSMHGKVSRRIPVSTIGYMCKELQSICCDYDGGVAHSKHAAFLRSKDPFSPILTGIKKLINLKTFVLIICTMKFVELLGIDSGMMKLIEKLGMIFWVILQYLEPPLKISTFHHMLDRVHISGKDLKKIGYSIDDLHTYTCRI